MQRLSREQLEACADAYDRAVAAEPGIDAFCTQSPWILSFHDAFHPDAQLFVAREGESFVVLAERRAGVLEPLEAMWGFACPLVGPDAPQQLAELAAVTGERGARVGLWLSGLPRAHERIERIARALRPRLALRVVAENERYRASLRGGVDGWLGRRSAKFRRNLRAARRRVGGAGIEFEALAPGDAAAVERCYARVLRIEAKSWKAASGNGVDQGAMREFYARLLPRLAERGALRVLFATRGGVDVGYLHGGVSGGLFRGLQFSFDAELRALGLGNALQAEMIERLCAAGLESYDLGSQSSYKRTWGEVGLTTLTALAMAGR